MPITAILCASLAMLLLGLVLWARQQRLIRALRSSESQTGEYRDLLYTTLSSIGDAVIATDVKGIITFLNPVAQQVSGWAGEAVGQPLDVVFAITNQYTGKIVENPVAVVLRDGGIGRLPNDTVLKSKDGRAVPVGNTSAPIRNWAGKLIGVVLVFRDLTARNEAVEAILRLASIVESSEDAIIGERLDGTITSWNDAATRIFGYSADEMIGSGATTLIPAEHVKDSVEIRERVGRGERVKHCDAVYRTKAGSEISVALTISPIQDAAGQITGASKIARDITGYKHMQDQLLHAQKLESLSVLAGGVAHEFNNLLMGIIANATLILDETPEGSATANSAQNVLIATEQAAQLTRQMLAYSGKGMFTVEPLSLTKQIQDLAALFRTSIPKSVDLRWNLDAGLPPIQADSGQIQQLLTNLILNGAEAIPSEGQVTISASLRQVATTDVRNLAGEPLPSGAYVVLEVRDTGVGMDEATQARMFDPFFTTKFPGRGLGLAAVLGIVRGHQGGISVLSHPGHGTTFQVFLPVSREAARAQSAA